MSSVISLLWTYMRTLWSHRNTIVHGATAEEQANTLLKGLHTTTTNYYQQFTDNPSFLLPHHHYLFTDTTLEECLCHSYNQLACWLHSVSKARQVLLHHDLYLQALSTPLYPPTDSSSSSYTPSNTSTVTTETSLTSSTSSYTSSTTGISLASSDSSHQTASLFGNTASSCPTIISWSTFDS
jgi:hypothetical protein